MTLRFGLLARQSYSRGDLYTVHLISGEINTYLNNNKLHVFNTKDNYRMCELNSGVFFNVKICFLKSLLSG